jgi:O-antigen/teichoic acid export membrane protein
MGQAISSGGNFALGVLLARWLGVEAFGQYSILWMGVLFVLGLHQAYFTQPLMALLPSKPLNGQAAYLEALTALQVLASVGLALLALLLYGLMVVFGIQTNWLAWLPIMGFLLGGYLLQDYFKKYCYAKRQLLVPLLMDASLFGLLLPALAVLYWLDELSLGHALFTMMVAYGISSSIGQSLIGGSPIKYWNRSTLFRTAKEHYHYSIWLLGTSMVQWFSGNFFLVSAAGMLGAVAVGALRMAQNIVGLCHVLFLAMENIVPAEAAQQFFTKGEPGLFAYLKRVGLMGSIPVGVLLIGLTLAAPWLMTWLYGAEYQSYAYLVAAFSVVYALGYALTILRMAMRSMHFTSPIFVGYLVSAGLSILAAGPVVRQWGIGGVLAGLIGSQMLLLLVYLAFIWRKRTTNKLAQNPILN